MNLVYLMAVGEVEPRFLEAVQRCVASLRRWGRFQDPVVIMTDQETSRLPAALQADAQVIQVDPALLKDPRHERSGLEKYLMAKTQFARLFDFSGYESVMYLDCDILAVRDINPLFQCRGDFCYAREFQSMSGPVFSGCLTAAEREQAQWMRGINSGAYAAPAVYLGECLEKWKRVLNEYPDGLAYDQPALNALILRREIRARAWPAFSVAYPSLYDFPEHFREQTCLLHYCGAPDKKFSRMQEHFDDLMAGRSIRVRFPDEARMETTRPVADRRSMDSAPGRRSCYRIAFNDNARGVESFALINAHYARELTARGHRIVPPSGDGTDAPDFVIWHNYLKDFSAPVPAGPGKHIAVRTSDFGPYPRPWVERINQSYDQLWVHSCWIRDFALAGGIDPDRIRLVPDGIDPRVFHPEGPRFELPTRKRFRFLFVGGAVLRKGIDILLDAYCHAFTRADDVALVIKDHARNQFYQEMPYRNDILRRAANPAGPEIVYLNDHLAPEQLAALYRACSVAVFPFRAEGFNIPALESLACGRPTLIPQFGPCLDFSNRDTSFIMPALRIQLPVKKQFLTKIGIPLDVESVDFCEVKKETLVDYLRRAYATSADTLSAMGAAGARLAHSRYTWSHVATTMEQYLDELALTPAPRRDLSEPPKVSAVLTS